MAAYTMELRQVLEITDLFDFTYSFDETYITKQTLQDLIIGKYYFYEIGSETIDRFKYNFKIDFITKLIAFSEKLKYYGSMLQLNSNSNTKYRSSTVNSTRGRTIQSPPMSNATPADRYASKRDINSDVNTINEQWTDNVPMDFYKDINKELVPIVNEFIDSLNENFMGVF